MTGHIAVLIPSCPIEVSTTAPYYESVSLIKLRGELNAAKSELDAIYADPNDTTPTTFTRIVDKYGYLKNKLSREYGAQHVSNAWLKYYEIIAHFRAANPKFLVPRNASTPIRAFFNAELPGSSLCAFNHYMKTHNLAFDWRAASIAPDLFSNGSSTLEDRYGLYAKYKSNWLMQLLDDYNAAAAQQPDVKLFRNTGDALNLEVIDDYARRIGPQSEWGGVDFYSHDAGIDVTNNYNEQEALNARIHLGCAIAGLLTLRVGGCFVAKQYTTFETITWNLIMIYATVFEKFYLSKPLTSRPYNSEIYLIGINYLGTPAAVMAALRERMTNFTERVNDKEQQLVLIPTASVRGSGAAAYNAILKFSTAVFGRQANELRVNVKLYYEYRRNMGLLSKKMRPEAEKVINEWLRNYQVRRIGAAQLL